jgi:thiol-disulfide isomerase/thioredoxin
VGRTTNKQRREQQSVSARERAAAARAEQKRIEQRKRAMTIIGAVVGVAVLVAVIAIVAITHKSSKTNTVSGNRAVATAAVVHDVSAVPVSTLNTVGVGPVVTYPAKVTGQPALTSGGKPEMLFIGAEFCPYCAAERWSMGVALSRFGTFNGYDTVSSSATDVDPSTPSLDFDKYKYSSKYLTFTAVENEDRNQKPLQNTTAAQNATWLKVGGSQSFPFVDFGNKFKITGPSFDPAILKGLSQAQIGSQLANPKSKASQAINGAANVITAAICGMTNNQPSTVCTSTITSLQSKFSG